MKINLSALAIITLAGMIMMPCFASDAPEVAKIASYSAKLHSITDHIPSVGKNLPGANDEASEQEILLELGHSSEVMWREISHLDHLLAIKSLMRDEVDKQVISAAIKIHIKFVVELLPVSTEVATLSMTHLKSPAGVTVARELKDNLNGLKELLQH
jgi:hypothetical protein